MKKLKFFISVFIISLFFVPSVMASSEYIILNAIKAFKDSPSGSRITSVGDEGYLQTYDKVIVLDKNYSSGNGCKNAWYKVKYNDIEGFICSSNQVVRQEATVDLNGSFEQEMLNKGFPSSYLPFLKTLHEKHSNWVFTPQITNLDFYTAVSNENIGEMSLINGSDDSLRKKDAYGNDIPSVNEIGWYVASDSTVAYYMDPRNFLAEEYVFMFENLQYNSTIHTRSAVQGVTSGTFLNTIEYLNYFMSAASRSGASPVYLASRVRQEKGVNGGIGTNGARFTFSIDTNCLAKYSDTNSWNAKNNCGTNLSYEGIFNYYNIGAYGSYMSPVTRGLIWAMGGFDSSVTTYLRPWNTREKAIIGGALFIANGYISANQNTLYLQRFNVAANAANATYTHQYMANVRAHASEAYSMYTGYKDSNLLNTTYEFLIPVYNNMPGESGVVTPPEQEIEKPVEVAKVSPENALVASGYKLNSGYLSNIGFSKDKNSLVTNLKAINQDLNVLSLKNKYNSEKNGVIGTGDVITISNGSTTSSYTAIVYGDNNGDGEVSILDLLRVQKYILGHNNLTDAEMIASDTNKDGLVSVVDLLRVQKQILGSINIEQ